MNLDDDLYRLVKIRAAEQGTTVTSLVERALEVMLGDAVAAKQSRLFELPVLPSAGGLLPGIDLTDNASIQDLLDADFSVEPGH